MAKGSGGTRSGGANTGGVVPAPAPEVKKAQYNTPSASEYIPVTDRGLTTKQRAVIEAFEKKWENSTVEHGQTVDKNGNVIKERRGGKRAIRWYFSELPEDGVLTHNHPIELSGQYEGLFWPRTGHSFSGADISAAISANLKEVRATTPYYAFSMRRPASGSWGVKPADFMSDYKSIYGQHKKELMAYAEAGGDMKTIRERYGRLEVILGHRTMRDLAKKYGFIYTKSRRNK